MDRVASRLATRRTCYPLYCLLFTMPGCPPSTTAASGASAGERRNGSDRELRPALELAPGPLQAPHPACPRCSPGWPASAAPAARCAAATTGQLHVAGEQLAFCRRREGELAVVAVNAADRPASLELHLPPEAAAACAAAGRLADALQEGWSTPVRDGRLAVELPAAGARVLLGG